MLKLNFVYQIQTQVVILQQVLLVLLFLLIFDYENDYFDPNNGGKAPWDNTKYLNVWIGNLTSIGLLGFATPPGTAGNDDGTVISHDAWGTMGTVVSPNHLGRTATHEIGHYLNLEHVWGLNGGCNDDDMVTDTPNQDTESGGCPTFPLLDNCTTSGDGVMFMNYMDYSDDACLVMFTAGQKARMLAALNGLELVYLLQMAVQT